jgi:hypothetical protein
MPRVLAPPKAIRNVRFGKGVEVRRSPQAVACRKRYVRELEKPQRLLAEVMRGNPPGLGHTSGDEPGNGVNPGGISDQGAVR